MTVGVAIDIANLKRIESDPVLPWCFTDSNTPERVLELRFINIRRAKKKGVASVSAWETQIQLFTNCFFLPKTQVSKPYLKCSCRFDISLITLSPSKSQFSDVFAPGFTVLLCFCIININYLEFYLAIPGSFPKLPASNPFLKVLALEHPSSMV